jgi:hypothetical protein
MLLLHLRVLKFTLPVCLLGIVLVNVTDLFSFWNTVGNGMTIIGGILSAATAVTGVAMQRMEAHEWLRAKGYAFFEAEDLAATLPRRELMQLEREYQVIVQHRALAALESRAKWALQDVGVRDE